PKVESTVVRLRPKKVKNTDFDKANLNRLVTAAFGQRRKTLRNALGALVTSAQFKVAEIDSSQRAETLSPDDYIRLCNASFNSGVQ
ncbi:MAG: rRNA adenine N-6-methyltransferase family protein, partial [Arenicellales bacterium]